MAFPFNGVESYVDAYLTVSQSVTAAMPNLDQVAYLEARSYTYPTTHALDRGRSDQEMIRSGKSVQSSLDLVLDNDYGSYSGQEDWTFNVSDGVTFLTSHWRKEKGTEGLHEDELDAMFTGGVYDQRSLAMTLVREDKKRKRRMIVGAAEKIEKKMWAPPTPEMERGAATNPVRSLPYFINEFPNGLYPGCTTQHGVTNPGQYTGPDGKQLLVCDQRPYYQGANDSTGFGHIFDVMDEAIEENRVGMIPNAPQYSVTAEMLKDSYPGFFTNTKGRTFISRTYRAHKDLFGGRDPYDAAARTQTFDGKPIIQVPSLKGAAIFPRYTDGTATGTIAAGALITDEDDNGRRGARLFLPKFDCIHHYYFAGKKFRVRDWYALDQSNPEAYVMHVRNKRTVHADRIRPHVLIYPGVDMPGYAATV